VRPKAICDGLICVDAVIEFEVRNSTFAN